MKWKLDSSVIDSVEVNDSEETIIEFKNGDRYKYQHISPGVITELVSSDSPGKYFNQQIRNRYREEKL